MSGVSIQSFINKEVDDSYSIILYINNLLDKDYIQMCYENLSNITEKDWRCGFVGNHQIKRLQQWYHMENKPFCSSWNTDFYRWQSCKYSDWLLDIQDDISKKIQDLVGDLLHKFNADPINFNSVLVNKYTDGRHFISAHRDSEIIFGNNPTIVSVSFGASRKFVLKRVIYDVQNPQKLIKDVDNSALDKTFDLHTGSIVVMAGSSQKYFSHEILHDPECNQPRFNLTFRNHKFN